jgi:hypothetical protein
MVRVFIITQALLISMVSTPCFSSTTTDETAESVNAESKKKELRSSRFLKGISRSSGGIGGMLNGQDSIDGGALTLDIDVYGSQRRFDGPWSVYGHHNTRLEIGTGFGVTSRGLMGHALSIDAPAKERVGLQVGIEGINYLYSANIDDDRVDFFEWMPAISVGIRVQPFKLCRVLLLTRAGVSIGTLADGGVRPMYGVGGYATCRVLDLAGTMTRVATSTQSVDLVDASLTMKVFGHYGIGLQFESINYRENGDGMPWDDPNAERRNEYRSFVILRYSRKS